MALKDILVHMDTANSALARLTYSSALAAAHGARLIGVFSLGRRELAPHLAAQLPAETLTYHDERLRELALGQEALFTRIALDHGLAERSRWRVADNVAGITLEALARYVDLTVIGAAPPDEGGWRGSTEPDQLILTCGRAVLITPEATAAAAPRRILVAWNGTREAARAVSEAMPLLEAAETVTILCVGDAPELAEPPGAILARHLDAHGIAASIDRVTDTRADPAEIILSRCRNGAADLVVMGAYGHSRLREIVLGGVTRTLLRRLPVPLLMAH